MDFWQKSSFQKWIKNLKTKKIITPTQIWKVYTRMFLGKIWRYHQHPQFLLEKRRGRLWKIILVNNKIMYNLYSNFTKYCILNILFSECELVFDSSRSLHGNFDTRTKSGKVCKIIFLGKNEKNPELVIRITIFNYRLR